MSSIVIPSLGGNPTGLNVPYLAISIVGFNLTPIPPKYIKSMQVERLANKAPGKFTIQLIAPINVFDSGNNDMSMILTYLANQVIDKGINDGNFTMIYGWLHGDLIMVNKAVVSGFDLNYNKDGFVDYTISGAVKEVSYASIYNAKKLASSLETENKESMSDYIANTDYLKNAPYESIKDLLTVGGLSGTIHSEIEWERFKQNTNSLNSIANLMLNYSSSANDSLAKSLLSKYTQLSRFIEDVAKYAYGNKYTVNVSHCDYDYDPVTLDKVESISSKIVDSKFASKSIFDYLKSLVANCKEFEDTGPLKTKSGQDIYYNSETGDYSIAINGEYYELHKTTKSENNGQNNSKIYDKITSDSNPLGQYGVSNSTPLSNLNIVGSCESQEKIDGKTVKYLTIDTTTGDNSRRENITQYTLTKVAEKNESKLKQVTSGKDTNNYEISFDALHSTIHIKPKNQTEIVEEYIISNNVSHSDVIDFSVGMNGIKWITVDAKLDNATSNSIDVNSGLILTSTTDIQGAVPLDAVNVKALQDAFLSKMAENVASNATEAEMTVIGSARASNFMIANTKIRVWPTINNSPTFWCGEYIVMGITDKLDESGFITTLKLNFSKSLYDEYVENKVSMQATSKGTDIDDSTLSTTVSITNNSDNDSE